MQTGRKSPRRHRLWHCPNASLDGRGHDNAAMESFFHTLKTEHVHHHKYCAFDEARQSLFDYIEVFATDSDGIHIWRT